MTKSFKILGLLWLLNLTPDYLLSQTLIIQCNNGIKYKYSVLSNELTSINKSVYDSLYSLKNTKRFNGNSFERDSNYCIRYFIDDKVLFVRYCAIRVIIKDTVLWTHGNIHCPINCEDCHEKRPNGYPCPQLSIEVVDFSKNNEWVMLVDKNGPMFSSRCTVVEYNLSTGLTKTYRRKVDNPSYSLDSNNLLMRNSVKTGVYYVYSRISGELVKKLSNVQEAFWIE